MADNLEFLDDVNEGQDLLRLLSQDGEHNGGPEEPQQNQQLEEGNHEGNTLRNKNDFEDSVSISDDGAETALKQQSFDKDDVIVINGPNSKLELTHGNIEDNDSIHNDVPSSTATAVKAANGNGALPLIINNSQSVQPLNMSSLGSMGATGMSVSTYQRRISAQQAQYRSTLASLRSENESLRDQITSLTVQLSGLETTISEERNSHSKEKSAYELQLRQIKIELEDKKQLNVKLTETINHLTNQNSSLEESVASIKESLNSKEHECREAITKMVSTNSVREERLRGEIASGQKRIDELKRDIETANAKAEKFVVDKSEQEKIIRSLQLEVEALNKKYVAREEEANREKSVQDTVAKAAQQELQNKITLYEEKLKTVENDNGNLKTQTESQKKKIAGLESALNDKNNKILDENNRLRIEISELQCQISELKADLLSKTAECDMEVTTLKEENMRLSNDLNVMSQRADILQKDNTEFRDLLAKREVQIGDYEKSNNSLRTNLETELGKLARAETRVKDLAATINELKKSIDTYSNEKINAENLVATLNAEISRLSGENVELAAEVGAIHDDLMSAVQEKEEISRENSSLKSKLVTMTSKRNELQGSYDKLKSEKAETSQSWAAKEANYIEKVATVSSQLEASEMENKMLKQSVDSFSKRLGNIELENEKKRQDHSRELDNLRDEMLAEVNEATKTVQAKDTEITGLTKKLQAVTEDKKMMAEKINEMTYTIDGLNKKISELNAELGTMKDSYDSSVEKYNSIVNDLQEKKFEVEKEISSSKDTLKKCADQITSLEYQLSSLKSEKILMTDQIKDLNAEKDEIIRITTEEKENFSEDIQRLTQELEECQEECAGLKLAQDEYVSLQNNYAKLENSYNELARKYNETRANSEGLGNALEQTKKRLNELDALKERIQRECTALKNSNNEIKGKLDIAEDEIKTLQQECIKRDSIIDSINNRNTLLSQKVTTMVDLSKDTERKLNDAQKANDILSDEKLELEKKKEELALNLERLEEDKSAVQCELSELRERLTTTMEENSKIQNALNEKIMKMQAEIEQYTQHNSKLSDLSRELARQRDGLMLGCPVSNTSMMQTSILTRDLNGGTGMKPEVDIAMAPDAASDNLIGSTVMSESDLVNNSGTGANRNNININMSSINNNNTSNMPIPSVNALTMTGTVTSRARDDYEKHIYAQRQQLNALRSENGILLATVQQLEQQLAASRLIADSASDVNKSGNNFNNSNDGRLNNSAGLTSSGHEFVASAEKDIALRAELQALKNELTQERIGRRTDAAQYKSEIKRLRIAYNRQVETRNALVDYTEKLKSMIESGAPATEIPYQSTALNSRVE